MNVWRYQVILKKPNIELRAALLQTQLQVNKCGLDGFVNSEIKTVTDKKQETSAPAESSEPRLTNRAFHEVIFRLGTGVNLRVTPQGVIVGKSTK